MSRKNLQLPGGFQIVWHPFLYPGTSIESPQMSWKQNGPTRNIRMPLGALWSPPGTWDLPLPPETQKNLDESRRITHEHEKVLYRLAYKSVDDPFKSMLFRCHAKQVAHVRRRLGAPGRAGTWTKVKQIVQRSGTCWSTRCLAAHAAHEARNSCSKGHKTLCKLLRILLKPPWRIISKPFRRV